MSLRTPSTNVNNLVQTRFGGNQGTAFDSYAKGRPELTRKDVESMLRDSGVKGKLRRRLMAARLMKQLDTNRSKTLSRDEFQNGLAKLGGTSAANVSATPAIGATMPSPALASPAIGTTPPSAALPNVGSFPIIIFP